MPEHIQRDLYTRLQQRGATTMYQPTPDQVRIFGHIPTFTQRLAAARAYIKGDINMHDIWTALNYTPHIKRVRTIRYLDSIRGKEQ